MMWSIFFPGMETRKGRTPDSAPCAWNGAIAGNDTRLRSAARRVRRGFVIGAPTKIHQHRLRRVVCFDTVGTTDTVRPESANARIAPPGRDHVLRRTRGGG